MCGRFTHLYSWRELHALLSLTLSPSAPEPAKSWNVAPGQLPLVVVENEAGERTARPMMWGFAPGKPAGRPGAPINARCETAAGSPLFRSSFRSRRCLVPANGFYEWTKGAEGDRKQPYYFTLADRGLFCFAGLWTPGEEGETFAIVTTTPNEMLAPVHDRMPVIVPREHLSAWVAPGPLAPGAAEAVLRPYPAEEMRAMPVSTRVNAPKNNDPSLVEPVSPAAPEPGLFSAEP